MVIGFNFPASSDHELPAFVVSCDVASEDVLPSLLSLKSFFEFYFPFDLSYTSTFVES